MKINQILLALFNFTLIITIIPIGSHGMSIRLVPISSLLPENLTLEERHYKLAEISKTHALHLQQSSRNSTKELAPNAIILQPSLRRTPLGYHMAQVSIGSKPFPTYLMIDSGSDLSWVQCVGCSPCFSLECSGNFKHMESQSFHYLPCNHPLCTSKLCDERGYCRYKIKYLGSSSQGLVLSDSFTFQTNSGPTTARYSGLAFGCGLANVNIPFGIAKNNVIAGVFGLGLRESSILVQLHSHTKRRFSYCLPPLDRPTSLHFGDNADIGGPIQETLLVRGMNRYYVLEVLGMSVDQTSLNINPEVFRLKRDRSGGFAVDSGSPYSYIVKRVYGTFKEKIVRYFAERNGRLRPMQKPIGIFELCYDMTSRGKSYVLPSVTFHFRGANLVMKPDVVFESFSSNIRCLAISDIDEPGPTISGAFQQTNHRFLFDGGRSVMAFAPENCV